MTWLAHVSLLSGGLPQVLRIGTAVALLATAVRRDSHWVRHVLPVAAALAVAVAVGAALAVSRAGLVDDPLPAEFWVWLGGVVLAAAVFVVGWRTSWWRRGLPVLAAVLAVVMAADVVDAATGYYPTIGDLYAAMAGLPEPEQVSLGALASVPATTTTGRVVPLDVPDTHSHFPHRQEYVYLPPVWFRRPHPRLPAIELIGGVVNRPQDWIGPGRATATADAYAARHGGWAPILVFPDPSGSYSNDTECVDGAGGDAEDHLVSDVPAAVDATFGVTSWGIAGWSMGGTCAVDLTLVHSGVFGPFLDISGDLGPNEGPRARTIATLYQGNTAAWAAHDPLTVLATHRWPAGKYGLFADGQAERATHTAAADRLARAARRSGIDATVVVLPGGHSWAFAATAFAEELPALAAHLGQPEPAAHPVTGGTG